jgi:hypothetical protein
MRIALALALGLFFLSVSASASPLCGDSSPKSEDLLSPKQWREVQSGGSSQDPVLREQALVQRAHRAGPSIGSKSVVPIAWDQAKKMILLGSVKALITDKGQEMRLVALSGSVFSTHEPTEGDARHLVDVVDPCHVFIGTWSKVVQRIGMPVPAPKDVED